MSMVSTEYMAVVVYNSIEYADTQQAMAFLVPNLSNLWTSAQVSMHFRHGHSLYVASLLARAPLRMFPVIMLPGPSMQC